MRRNQATAQICGSICDYGHTNTSLLLRDSSCVAHHCSAKGSAPNLDTFPQLTTSLRVKDRTMEALFMMCQRRYLGLPVAYEPPTRGAGLTSAFPKRISITKDNQVVLRLVLHDIPFVAFAEMENGILIYPIASDGIIDTNVGGRVDSGEIAHCQGPVIVRAPKWSPDAG